jgi:RNA polymerase sigma factor (sigma-70 family)
MRDLPESSPALADLSRRMVRGDDEAWQAFHRTYGATLFRMLLGLTRGDPHRAAEGLQQAYLRISRHVRICDNERMWIGWLRLVARSALSDARRRDNRFLSFLTRWRSDPSANSAASSPDEDDQTLAALDASLATLDDDTRALLRAKYLEGRPVDAIANSLGLTAKAVESRLTRARAELREALKELLSKQRYDEENP